LLVAGLCISWPRQAVGAGGAGRSRATAPGAVAALQNVTPNEFRGQISALYLFTIGVIGGGIGPLVVGLLNDYVFHDEAMLRYSMVVVTVVFGGLGLWLKFVCLPPYKERVARVIAHERAGA
jgi:MFS family permease